MIDLSNSSLTYQARPTAMTAYTAENRPPRFDTTSIKVVTVLTVCEVTSS